MKTIGKQIVIGLILLVNFAMDAISQPSIYRNGDGTNVGASATNQGNTPVNSSLADDGFIILLMLAVVYAAVKFHQFKMDKTRIPAC